MLKIIGRFWRYDLPRTFDESTVWVEILRSAAAYILTSPKLCKTFFLQKEAFSFPSLDYSRIANRKLFTLDWKLGKLQLRFDKIYTSYQHYQCFLRFYTRTNRNSWFCWRCKLWIYRLVRKNGTKHSIFFDQSFEQICNSNFFAGFALGGRNHGLRTIILNTLVSSKWTLLGSGAPEHSHFFLQISPRRDASHYTTHKFRVWIRPRYLTPRPNIPSPRSFID